MNVRELREIRKKQFISINIFSFTIAIIFGSIIVLFETSRLTVLLLLIIFIAGSALHTWLEMDGKEWRLFAWSRKLVNYEKGKLGREWMRLKRSELTSKLFLILLFVFQLFLGQASAPFFPTGIGFVQWLYLIIGILLFTNISIYFRTRKIDRLSTDELQGLTKQEFGVGLVLGLVMLMIVITFTFLFVIET